MLPRELRIHICDAIGDPLLSPCMWYRVERWLARTAFWVLMIIPLPMEVRDVASTATP